jgi:hypothetical protein
MLSPAELNAALAKKDLAVRCKAVTYPDGTTWNHAEVYDSEGRVVAGAGHPSAFMAQYHAIHTALSAPEPITA